MNINLTASGAEKLTVPGDDRMQGGYIRVERVPRYLVFAILAYPRRLFRAMAQLVGCS